MEIGTETGARVSAASYKNILFVDYENRGNVDLNAIPADVFVPFFFGVSQNSVATDFALAMHTLGARILPVKIEDQGKNALDFHIAYYLGEYLAANPHASCVILSKDKGFDPLVKHLRGRGFAVRRAETVVEAFGHSKQNADNEKAIAESAQPKTEEPKHLTTALQWLKSMQTRTRPRQRKGLIAHLYTHFGRKVSDDDLHSLVDRMIAEKKISETNGTLGYHL